jgi:hypothetical protein
MLRLTKDKPSGSFAITSAGKLGVRTRPCDLPKKPNERKEPTS